MLTRRASSLCLIILAEFDGLHLILARSLNMRIYMCHIRCVLRCVSVFMMCAWILILKWLCGGAPNEKIHGSTSRLLLLIRSCITQGWLTAWRRGKMVNLLAGYMELP